MDGERPISSNSNTSGPEKSGEEVDLRLEFNPHEQAASQELVCMEKLVASEWGSRWGEPLTADELLVIGRDAFEPMFHKPPVGPIPEYLAPHLSVQGCVAEYEEKLEELDRWKALELSRWLKDRIGKTWRIGGKMYELQAESEAAFERFWLSSFDDAT